MKTVAPSGMKSLAVVVRRGVLPAIGLALGIAALVYGAGFRQVKVLEEQEEEVTIKIPLPGAFAMDPDDDRPRRPRAGDDGWDDDPSNFLTKKVKRKVDVWKDEFEPALVRDITIGGLVRLASGELKRTYSGKPPSLCPT